MYRFHVARAACAHHSTRAALRKKSYNKSKQKEGKGRGGERRGGDGRGVEGTEGEGRERKGKENKNKRHTSSFGESGVGIHLHQAQHSFLRDVKDVPAARA